MTRKIYRSKGGFRDGTDCLECIDGRVFWVGKDGLRKPFDHAYTEKECDELVARGDWTAYTTEGTEEWRRRQAEVNGNLRRALDEYTKFYQGLMP